MTHDHEAWRDSYIAVDDAFHHVDRELFRGLFLLLLEEHVGQKESALRG